MISDGFSPVSPSLDLRLTELWHRVWSAVLGGVKLSEVFSPLNPRLWGRVWETGFSGSRGGLDIVGRIVLLGVELSEALTPLSPGLVGPGHAS